MLYLYFAVDKTVVRIKTSMEVKSKHGFTETVIQPPRNLGAVRRGVHADSTVVREPKIRR